MWRCKCLNRECTRTPTLALLLFPLPLVPPSSVDVAALCGSVVWTGAVDNESGAARVLLPVVDLCLGGMAACIFVHMCMPFRLLSFPGYAQ